MYSEFQSTLTLTTGPSAPSWSSWPFAIALAQFAALAVEHGPGEPVATLAAVQLHQDSAAIALIVYVGQDIKALHHAAPLLQGPGQFGRPIVGLQGANQSAGLHEAELERAGQAQQVVPILSDQWHRDPLARQAVQGPVIGVGVQAPEAGAANVGEPGAELEAK